MGRLRQICNSPRFLIVVFLLLAFTTSFASSHCKVGHCSSQYSHALESRQVWRGPSFAYCTILKKYLECIQANAKHCRGNLQYHSVSSLVVSWTNDFNCTQVIAQGPSLDSTPPLFSGDPSLSRGPTKKAGSFQEPPEECGYRGHHPTQHRFCGLFGDPHLRTFYDEFHNCRALGAWPLIDNPYMAVQITNELVNKDTGATATSKVTVIVRSHGACTGEKTYEAWSGGSSNDPLPGSFVDGSRAGGASVRLREEVPGKHIEITVRHAAARIVIRQVGRHLTFAARMPSEVATLGAHSESLELCVRGCPRKEQLTDAFSVSHRLDSSSTDSVGEARASCRRQNVTDPYLDACIFDLLTTGDSSYVQAAQHAMIDARTLGAPLVRQNRTFTEPQVVPQGQRNVASRTTLSAVLILWVALLRISGG